MELEGKSCIPDLLYTWGDHSTDFVPGFRNSGTGFGAGLLGFELLQAATGKNLG